MVSQETLLRSIDPVSSPRISFSSDFLDDKTFISISPNIDHSEKERVCREEFEFLSTNNSLTEEMLSADELFSEGKLLPFFQINQCEKLNKINIGDQRIEDTHDQDRIGKDGRFIDEDPSPRPPSCTVLWKELLRLKKQNPSLSHSTSSSSSSSSSSGADIEEGKNEKSAAKRVYKKQTSIKIRPVVNVPICSYGRSNRLPPLSSFKKGRLES